MMDYERVTPYFGLRQVGDRSVLLNVGIDITMKCRYELKRNDRTRA